MQGWSNLGEQWCWLNNNCTPSCPDGVFYFLPAWYSALSQRHVVNLQGLSRYITDSNNLLKWTLMKTGRYLFLIKGQYVRGNRCPNLFWEYLGNKYFLMLYLLFLLQVALGFSQSSSSLLYGCYNIHPHSMVSRCQLWLFWFCRWRNRDFEKFHDLIKVIKEPEGAAALDPLRFLSI